MLTLISMTSFLIIFFGGCVYYANSTRAKISLSFYVKGIMSFPSSQGAANISVEVDGLSLLRVKLYDRTV